jgi:hypothetical protein
MNRAEEFDFIDRKELNKTETNTQTKRRTGHFKVTFLLR